MSSRKPLLPPPPLTQTRREPTTRRISRLGLQLWTAYIPGCPWSEHQPRPPGLALLPPPPKHLPLSPPDLLLAAAQSGYQRRPHLPPSQGVSSGSDMTTSLVQRLNRQALSCDLLHRLPYLVEGRLEHRLASGNPVHKHRLVFHLLGRLLPRQLPSQRALSRGCRKEQVNMRHLELSTR